MNLELETDELTIVAGFERFVNGLTWNTEALLRDAEAAEESLTRDVFAALQQGGWDTLPSQEVSFSCLLECAKAFYNRVIPIPVPLLEIWLAELVRVNATDGRPPGAFEVLSLDDAVQPAHSRGDSIDSGRIPTNVAANILTISGNENKWALYEGLPGNLDTHQTSSIDASMPAFRYAGTPDQWTLVGHIPPESVQLLAAQALSLASACLVGQAVALADVTVQYMKDRFQFGVPIGSFQALKHRQVDASTQLHLADAVSKVSGWAVESLEDPLPLSHMANAMVGEAAMQVAQEALQFHGGIGYTWENGIHFAIRRCADLSLAGCSTATSWEFVGRSIEDPTRVVWPAELGDLTAGSARRFELIGSDAQ